MKESQRNGPSVVSMPQTAKWIRMVVLAIGYIGTGTSYTAVGPSLIDLEIRTSSATKDLALMFLLRACGGLIGSLFSGYIFDIINADIILAVVEVAAGVVIGGTPWWQHYIGVSVCLGVSGLLNGIVNVGVMTYCVAMWGPANPPYLMLLAFLNSGVSSVMAPIVRSLLLPTTSPQHINIANNTAFNLTYTENHIEYSPTWNNMTDRGLGNSTADHSAFAPDDVKVQYAFLVPAACFTAACIGHLVISVSQGCTQTPLFNRQKASTKESSGKKGQGEMSRKMARWKTIVLVITFGILSANVGTLSESYSMYLFSFLVRHLNWTKLNATWPLLAVGTSNYISQVLFIGIARCLKSSLVMAILQAAMLVSNIIMCFPIASDPPAFWMSAILCGLAFGPLGSTMVSWMSSVFGASGKIASYFFTILYLSRMVSGYLTGYLFDTRGPIWFVYVNIISVGVSTAAYGLTVMLTEMKKEEKNIEHGEIPAEDPSTVPMMNDN